MHMTNKKFTPQKKKGLVATFTRLTHAQRRSLNKLVKEKSKSRPTHSLSCEIREAIQFYLDNRKA